MQKLLAIAQRTRSATLILLLITVLKAGLFLALNAAGRLEPFVGDNAKVHYIPTAMRILSEGRFNGPDSRPDSKVPPGYPLVIAGALAVAGRRGSVLVAVLQMVADFGVAMAMYWLGRRMSAAFTGLLAGAAWLVYPPEAIISTWMTSETIFTLFLVLGVTALLWALEGSGVGCAAAAGLLFGIATMFRGTSLMLPLVLLPVFWRLRRVRLWLAATAAMAVVVVPWTIRNYVVLRDFIPVSVGSGSVMLQGSDARFFSGEGKASLYTGVFAEAARAGIRKPESGVGNRWVDGACRDVGVRAQAARASAVVWAVPGP